MSESKSEKHTITTVFTALSALYFDAKMANNISQSILSAGFMSAIIAIGYGFSPYGVFGNPILMGIVIALSYTILDIFGYIAPPSGFLFGVLAFVLSVFWFIVLMRSIYIEFMCKVEKEK